MVLALEASCAKDKRDKFRRYERCCCIKYVMSRFMGDLTFCCCSFYKPLSYNRASY